MSKVRGQWPDWFKQIQYQADTGSSEMSRDTDGPQTAGEYRTGVAPVSAKQPQLQFTLAPWSWDNRRTHKSREPGIMISALIFR